MDPNVTTELKIRRRLDNIFNKEPSDFSDKKTYDDYLEQKETYVFNLLLGESVAETEAKIAEYTRVNQDSIARNRAAQAGIQNSANAEAAVTVSTAPVQQPAQQGYVPTARQTGPSAIPVPIGKPQLTREKVASASGWSARTALMKAFNSAKQFWM